MPKRKSKFNLDMQSEFPFIKKARSDKQDDSEVRCDKCGSQFSVAHSGRGDIVKHLNTDRHKNALKSSASSGGTITNYYSRSELGEKEAQLAAAEGTLAYHTLFH